ncbi:MAG: tetratricopeptide repeat protein, partial [Chitinivibrionales bacterium]
MEEWLDYTEFSDRVEELIELGFHEEAYDLLDRYRDQYSCYWEYWFFSAQIDSEHEKYEKALEELEKALGIDPGNAVCKQNLFSVLRLMEREEEALEYMQRALEEHPEEDFLINSLLQYYIDNAEYKKALILFRSKAGLLKNNPEALKYAGAAYYYLGQYEEALKFLKRAYKRDSESSEIRDMLADVLLALGNEDEAVNLYYEFLKRSPKNVYIMSKLISILTSISRYQEAKSEAEKLKEYFPRSAVGYVNLAYVHLNSGDPDNALLEANTALNIDSGSIEGLRAK